MLNQEHEFERKIRDIVPEGEKLESFLEDCNPYSKETVEDKVNAYEKFAERVFGLNIEWFHREWVDMYLRHERCCVMAPRQHGKCQSAGTLIETEAGLVPIEKITTGTCVISMTEDLKIVKSKVVDCFPNGKKQCIRMKLSSGKEISSTPNHKYYTIDGWKELSSLSIGDWVATPRTTDVAFEREEMDIRLVKFLAYFIADGCRSEYTPRISTTHPKRIDELKEIITSFGGWFNPQKGYTNYLSYGKNNPLANILYETDLHMKYSYEKFVPDCIFQLPNNQLSVFLNRLFSCDGWASVSGGERETCQIGYGTASEQLAKQVQLLLLRFGIKSRVDRRRAMLNGRNMRDGFMVLIQQKDDMLSFIRQIGFFDKDISAVEKALKNKSCEGIDDCIPPTYRKHLKHSAHWHRCNSGLRIDNGYATSRSKLQKLLDESDFIQRLQTSDVYWDQITSIKDDGVHETYDLQIEDTHCFVAEGIITHNTTVLAIVFPLWISFFSRDKAFLIVSNIMDHSTHIIEEIRRNIFDNELLNLMRSEERERIWTRTKVVTNKNCTILCRPYRYNIKGGTYDHVLCVPQDTLIETKGGGRRIDEVKEGMEVKTHLGRFKKVLRIFNNPPKPLYEIRYGKNGSVSVTGNHPVLAKRGMQQPKFIKAERLWMTDKLCYPLRGKVEMLRIPQIGRKPSASSMRVLSSLAEENRHRRFVYYPIKSITKKNTIKRLYNLEVEDDNSYVANGVAVHNCDEGSLYKDHDIFFRAICPTVVARKGHIMVIGTPESELDLLYELKLKAEQEDSTYVFKRYQAIDDEGHPLWPEKYSKDHLIKVKENDGSIQFIREYMCEMVDQNTQAFPPRLIVKAFDLNESFRTSPVEGYVYHMGSDLAISPQGDYIVHLVLGKGSDGRLLVTNMLRSRGRGGSEYASQVDTIDNLYKTYNPVRCCIDRSLYGDALINSLKVDRHVPAEGFDFHPEMRNMVVNNLVRLFENERIIIPRMQSSHDTIMQTDILVSELSKFVITNTRTGQRTYASVGKHDDSVMALAMAAWSADQQRKFLPYMRAI